MFIHDYPAFQPIALSMRPELHPGLAQLPDGISEFTFAGLYLFRKTYDYHVAWLPDAANPAVRKLAIRGKRDGKTFYAFPHGLPDDPELRHLLLSEVDYAKGLSDHWADASRIWAEQNGRFVWEDRDNFDYLYLREDLATLNGKKYHKKRNHVNAFLNNYQYEERKFCSESIKEAYYILDAWHEERGRDDDYFASKEALDLCKELEQCGYLVTVDGKPAAYTMGESLQKGKTFVVHIEKAIAEYKGVYQFINMAFAAVLPQSYTWINREQDLGNPGLRQAKMTYLPCGFVKKYRIYPVGAELPVSLGTTELPTTAETVLA
jgi:hypothetical protein